MIKALRALLVFALWNAEVALVRPTPFGGSVRIACPSIVILAAPLGRISFALPLSSRPGSPQCVPRAA
jgi:hypothetical protein